QEPGIPCPAGAIDASGRGCDPSLEHAIQRRRHQLSRSTRQRHKKIFGSADPRPGAIERVAIAGAHLSSARRRLAAITLNRIQTSSRPSLKNLISRALAMLATPPAAEKSPVTLAGMAQNALPWPC